MAGDLEKALPFKKKPSLMIEMDADKPSTDDATTEEDEGAEDYQAAASEVLDAIKAGDAAGFAQALKAFVLTCK